jgi:hypothetical protein
MVADSNFRDETDQARERFTVQIKCRCGQVGAAVWEENARPGPKGPRPVLLEVSSGFYFRVQKKNIGVSEIACAVCESIVRD